MVSREKKIERWHHGRKVNTDARHCRVLALLLMRTGLIKRSVRGNQPRHQNKREFYMPIKIRINAGAAEEVGACLDRPSRYSSGQPGRHVRSVAVLSKVNGACPSRLKNFSCASPNSIGDRHHRCVSCCRTGGSTASVC